MFDSCSQFNYQFCVVSLSGKILCIMRMVIRERQVDYYDLITLGGGEGGGGPAHKETNLC